MIETVGHAFQELVCATKKSSKVRTFAPESYKDKCSRALDPNFCKAKPSRIRANFWKLLVARNSYWVPVSVIGPAVVGTNKRSVTTMFVMNLGMTVAARVDESPEVIAKVLDNDITLADIHPNEIIST